MDQPFAVFPQRNSSGNRDSQAGRRRRIRITRTIDGFHLFAMSAPVPMLAMFGIIGRGIIGAGAERAAEKKENQFPRPEAAPVPSVAN